MTNDATIRAIPPTFSKLKFFKRAIKVAEADPDSGLPFMVYEERVSRGDQSLNLVNR
jgi:hypothetical protein